jgi:hypothetical protein
LNPATSPASIAVWKATHFLDRSNCRSNLSPEKRIELLTQLVVGVLSVPGFRLSGPITPDDAYYVVEVAKTLVSQIESSNASQ